MSEADLAIGGGGTTTWERCCVGLPSFSIALAENQLKVIEHAAINGLVYAPRFDRLDSKFFAQHVDILIKNRELLRMLSINSLASTDGRGVKRVLRFMGYSLVHIRRASKGDCESIFDWRNNIEVRQASKNSQEIDWLEHQKWYSDVIENPNTLLLIGEIEGLAVGVVRFDVENIEASISIYLSPEGRNRCIGVDLLSAAEECFIAYFPHVKLFTAEVLANNISSHMLFQSFDYSRQSTTYFKNIRKN
jgi:L-amino acid N-acyltransferase YncA